MSALRDAVGDARKEAGFDGRGSGMSFGDVDRWVCRPGAMAGEQPSRCGGQGVRVAD